MLRYGSVIAEIIWRLWYKGKETWSSDGLAMTSQTRNTLIQHRHTHDDEIICVYIYIHTYNISVCPGVDSASKNEYQDGVGSD